MRTWLVLFRKECLELLRSYKWLWVPLIFLLLGIAQPITSYLLPDLLKVAGNLPEGAIMEIPLPRPGESLASVLSNYNTIGLLVLTLAFMSSITGERQRGITSLILAKPVSAFAYLSSKWTASVMLAWASLLLGYGGAWYYADMLLGKVNVIHALEALLLYALWLAFLMALLILVGSWLASGGAAAAVTLLTATALSLATGLFANWLVFSPSRLVTHAEALLMKGQPEPSLGLSLGVCLGAILVLLALAQYRFARSSHAPK